MKAKKSNRKGLLKQTTQINLNQLVESAIQVLRSRLIHRKK
jgi:hypothetical protein